MMMKTNPITPPRELVREWYGSEDCPDGANALANYLCTQAAQWGADQELEACCLLLDNGEHAASYGCHNGTSLRNARRPKPPSLKEQALMTDQEFDQLFDNGESILETLDLSTAHRINCPTDLMTNQH
jgi:hypothetical protein